MKLDILAFGAHPDDIEISAGGMLISEVRKGRKIGLVDLTRGEMGTRGTAEIRAKEADDAARIIGASVRINLEMPDATFELNQENKMKIIDVIRTYRPDIVIANSPSDRHPDHGRAAQLVIESCFLSGLEKMIVPGSHTEAWRPKAVYQYMQFYHHEPDFIYDISEVNEEKIKCILAHKSQFYDPDSKETQTVIASKQFKDNLSCRASEYGMQAGFSYGEPFMAVRTIGVKDIMMLF